MLWDPARKVVFGPDDLHDATGYNPYAGRRVTGWPRTVLSRGEVIVKDGRVAGTPGRGRRIPMALSADMKARPTCAADVIDYPA